MMQKKKSTLYWIGCFPFPGSVPLKNVYDEQEADVKL